jgi:hypothetical protein
MAATFGADQQAVALRVIAGTIGPRLDAQSGCLCADGPFFNTVGRYRHVALDQMAF